MENIILANEALEKFRVRFKKSEFEIIDNDIISTDDRTLLLLNSSMAIFKGQMNIGSYINKSAIIQKCLRNNDDVYSLSTFHMLGIVGMIAELKNAFNELWNYLTLDVELNHENIYCVVHKEDMDIQKSWLECSDNEHMVLIDEDDRQYSTRWKYGEGYELYGRGCTFVYLQPDGEACCDTCGILCNCRRHIQFGNVIIVHNKKNTYIDFGFGLERMLSCHYNNDIFKIPFYNKRLNYVMNEMGCEMSKGKEIVKLMENIKTMFDNGILPGHHKADYIMKKNIRQIINFMISIGQNEKQIDESISILFSLYNNVALVEIVSLEKQKYYNSLKKNIRKAGAWMKKQSVDYATVKQVLYERYGIPEVIIQKIGEGSLYENNRIEFRI